MGNRRWDMKDGKLKPSTINYLYIYMDHGANVYRV